MRSRWINSITAACFVGAASVVCAGDNSVTFRDKHFLRDSSEMIQEIQRLGQLAQTQGQDPKVKELGQKLVRDYGQAGQQLSSAAQAAGITETPQLSGKASRTVNHLAGLSGAEFDRAVVDELFKCQEADAHQLDLESRDGSNVSIRQAAVAIQTTVEPDLWNTTQLNGQYKGHI